MSLECRDDGGEASLLRERRALRLFLGERDLALRQHEESLGPRRRERAWRGGVWKRPGVPSRERTRAREPLHLHLRDRGELLDEVAKNMSQARSCRAACVRE